MDLTDLNGPIAVLGAMGLLLCIGFIWGIIQHFWKDR